MKRKKNGDGSFRTRPNGSIEYRVSVELESGLIVRKSFVGATESECRRKRKQFERDLIREKTVYKDIKL